MEETKGINRDIQRKEQAQNTKPRQFSVEYYEEVITKEVTPTMRDLVRRAYKKPAPKHKVLVDLDKE